MITKRHATYNIEYSEITTAEAQRMASDVVAGEINRLSKRLAEAEFLLACHGDGMSLPVELRYDWPADDYRIDGDYHVDPTTSGYAVFAADGSYAEFLDQAEAEEACQRLRDGRAKPANYEWVRPD